MSNTSRMLSATVHGELARSAFRPSPPGWLSSWPTALASAVTALIPGTGPRATKLRRHSDLRRSERRGQHRQDRETLMNVAKWVPCVRGPPCWELAALRLSPYISATSPCRTPGNHVLRCATDRVGS